MKTIIAGSRTIDSFADVEAAIKLSGFQITEVISGGAQGVDTVGVNWAVANKVPFRYFYADWKNLGKAAGPIRNSQMAAEAEALILVWDGKSRGSQDMRRKAQLKGLKIFEHIVTPQFLKPIDPDFIKF